jgi:hypothetical protein
MGRVVSGEVVVVAAGRLSVSFRIVMNVALYCGRILERCFLPLFGTLLALSYQTTKPAMARYSWAALRAPYTERA